MTRLPASAARGPAWTGVVAPAATIAAAFWALAWLAPQSGEPPFMAAVAVAVAGYVWAAVRLVANGALETRALVICCALALSWRAPMLALPDATAHDAVRYLWDARVSSAGLSPYETRPDDEALAALHSEVTRGVDAAWLPTIYPPVAQVYFRLVTAVHESITGFRVAALVSDAAIVLVLVLILRATGRPLGWALLYAWHPLVPLEGASGAHLDFAGALALVVSWLALLHRRPTLAALAFAAAVMVKPLPIVLAPLYWRRIRLRDAALAAAAALAVTAWIARGDVPLGSMGTFVDVFRFNGPLFKAMRGVAPPRAIAAVAVSTGLIVAIWLRKTREVGAPEAWAWPMSLALLASPVIYPWYLVWLIPFATSRTALPVWAWTLSVLAVYPVWYLRRLGAPFAVPPLLLLVEFALPAAAVLYVLANRAVAAPRAVGAAHG